MDFFIDGNDPALWTPTLELLDGEGGSSLGAGNNAALSIDNDTQILVTFTPTVSIDKDQGFYGIIMIEEYQKGGIYNQYQISTEEAAVNDNPLKIITPPQLTINDDGTNVTSVLVQCMLSKSWINPDSQYSIFARLGYKENIPCGSTANNSTQWDTLPRSYFMADSITFKAPDIAEQTVALTPIYDIDVVISFNANKAQILDAIVASGTAYIFDFQLIKIFYSQLTIAMTVKAPDTGTLYNGENCTFSYTVGAELQKELSISLINGVDCNGDMGTYANDNKAFNIKSETVNYTVQSEGVYLEFINELGTNIYTKTLNLKISEAGELVTIENYLLFNSISLLGSAPYNFYINNIGEIWQYYESTWQLIGTLIVVSFEHPEFLHYLGNNYYTETIESGTPVKDNIVNLGFGNIEYYSLENIINWKYLIIQTPDYPNIAETPIELATDISITDKYNLIKGYFDSLSAYIYYFNALEISTDNWNIDETVKAPLIGTSYNGDIIIIKLIDADGQKTVIEIFTLAGGTD